MHLPPPSSKKSLPTLLLLASSAHAANTTWIFKFDGTAAAFGNANPAGILATLHIDPPGPSGATFESPNGTQGFVSNDSADPVSEGFPNLAAFETADANPATPWSLAQGSSNYNFSPDFSAIDPNSIPIVTINSPTDASTTANPPTFHWTTTGTTNIFTGLQISNPTFTVDELFNLPGNASSFTLPAPLPAGTYNLLVSVSAAAVTLPVTTTLVSGPDLSIKPQGSFQFASEAIESFSVNPALLGDANADNQVDLSDLSTVLNNFGQSTPNWSDGNFDNTPTIDLTDLSDVLNNFGQTTPTTTAATTPAPTPQPASLSIAALSLLLLPRRRRI